MARSTWKGNIPLGGMVTLQVEAFKATERYAGDESLKTVCGCNSPSPFLREEKCVHGKPRLTDEGVKAGRAGTKARLAAVRPDGSYAAIPATELSAIDAAVNSDEIEPLALLDAGAWPSHTVNDLWYLAPNRKVNGSGDAVAVFYAYLADSGKVLIGRWSTRGRQHVVAIHAVDGVLAMNRVRYAQEVREPDEAMKAPARTQVDPKVVTMMGALLDTLPGGFNVAEVQDESVTKKAAAVQKALAGELASSTTEVTTEQPTETPDLMAALQASIEAKGKPAKKATKAKAKVAA